MNCHLVILLFIVIIIIIIIIIILYFFYFFLFFFWDRFLDFIWGVCHYSSILVAFEATFKFVPHRFPSMPNGDCSRRRVMLMPFWWTFWSWAVVKRLNILQIQMGVRYIAISALSTVLMCLYCHGILPDRPPLHARSSAHTCHSIW